ANCAAWNAPAAASAPDSYRQTSTGTFEWVRTLAVSLPSSRPARDLGAGARQPDAGCAHPLHGPDAGIPLMNRMQATVPVLPVR
ncbi:MAG: hypothetical protein ACREB3_06680, partial [Burkholderiales bacterium]